MAERTALTREFINEFPIADLHLHPRNARRGDVEAVKESLDWHGQYKPLVVQRLADDGTPWVVCAGNHTLIAMRDLSWTECDIVALDIDDEQAMRILLVDNRTSDHGDYDDDSLAALLGTLAGSDDGLTGSGYDDEYLTELQSLLDVPDLDDLSDDEADPADPSSLWPVLRFKVSPETRDRYDRLTAGVAGDDHDLFCHLLDLADRAP